MNLKKGFICVVAVLLASLSGRNVHAQQTLVDVSIDTESLLIGQQTLLHLTVTTDKDKELLIPLPGEKLTEGVEVLTIVPPDTADIKNNRIEIRYDLLITSFDSALYLLPRFFAIDGRDTIFSGQLALKVISPEVDIEHPDEFYDIKTIWRPPFVLADYYGWIFGIQFALLLICIIGYLIQRKRNKKPLIPVKAVPKLPPYEQAVKELKEIKERKLWQQGRSKEYYTEVTDTLRRYISAQYGASAMEKTSAEILDIIRNEEPANMEVYAVLRQILELSDFVKFAKFNPLPDENDLSMTNAHRFVEMTHLEEQAAEPAQDKNDNKKNDLTNK